MARFEIVEAGCRLDARRGGPGSRIVLKDWSVAAMAG